MAKIEPVLPIDDVSQSIRSIGSSRQTIALDLDNYLMEVEAADKGLTKAQKVRPSELDEVLDARKRSAREYQLLYAYYFQLRSMAIFTDIADEATLMEALDQWRKACLPLAAHLTVLHARRGIKVPPSWIQIAKGRLAPILERLIPDFNRIMIEIDQVPRLQCRASADRNIRVSALTREAYLQFNIVMFAHIGRANTESRSSIVTSMLRMMLPYFVQMNDCVPISRLPQGFGGSADSMRYAYLTTYLQMLFLLGHEYGHLYYGHEKSRADSKEVAIKRELEADRFSYLTVALEDDQSEMEAGLYPSSVHWLLEIQKIDEVVGCLLRGQTFQIDQLVFEQRKNALSDLIEDPSDMLLIGGIDLLKEIRERIIALGPASLKAIADEVTRDVTDGSHKRWWEDL